MGSGYSEPIHPQNLGYLVIGLHRPDVLRLIHAPSEVVAATITVVSEIDAALGYIGGQVEQKEKFGAVQITLKCTPFSSGKGQECSTAGKLFCLRMFEELHKLGYDPVVSSDLSRRSAHATWFFKRVCLERPMKHVTCLAPGQSDRLVVLRAGESFLSALDQAINVSWRKGIKSSEKVESIGESIIEIKLKGSPWQDDQSGEDSVLSREMLIHIVGRLGENQYKLIIGTNIKGRADALFFMHDSDFRASPAEFSIISLNKKNLLRVINCNEMVSPLKTNIVQQFAIENVEENMYGCYEFGLQGKPWKCSGQKAISSRRLILQILASMFSKGWALTTTLDMSRNRYDKSVWLFVRSEPVNTKFACIALSESDKISFLGFPVSVKQALREVILQNYLPGVMEEKEKEEDCHEMRLIGKPWEENYCENLHAQSTLAVMMSCATKHGWRVVASADVSTKYISEESEAQDTPCDVHSWYLVYWPDGGATGNSK